METINSGRNASVIVIGGGAAGFFAAIRCAECFPKLSILILERGKELLGKVKISGGGRCNVTHACFIPKDLVNFYPRGQRELLGPFTRFACGDTMEWFESRGVPLKIEEDGRVFPVSDNSQSIMDCLLTHAHNFGIRIHTNTRLDGLIPPQSPEQLWVVETSNGTYQAEKVIVASGSNPRVWDILSGIGHTIVPPVPSLFTFNIKDDRLAGLQGLSVPEASVAVEESNLEAFGPLLITHWGLSGPGILRLSSWGARELATLHHQFRILVNWTGRTAEEIGEEIDCLKIDHGKKFITAKPQFNIPLRLWKSLLMAAGLQQDSLRWGDLSKIQRQQLITQLCKGCFSVHGKSTFKEEFVTAGGVDLRELNFKRFESKICPGLFMVGEVLDIDAITGGFNFQAAWTGGWIAGAAAGDNLL